MKKVKIIVKGFVQGVGFRYFIYRNAQALNLSGYAKNLINGNVEVLLEGDDNNVDEMISILKQGPSRSIVNSIELDYSDFKGEYIGFSIL